VHETCFVEFREESINKIIDRMGHLPEISVENEVYFWSKKKEHISVWVTLRGRRIGW
jgi:hypothetical protein